jgi:putative PIN family toxin of toxin-antitoxin system
MKVMVDTNVIISALLFTKSVPAKVLFDISKRHDLVLCDYIIEEIYDVIRRKRPDLIADTDVLLAELTFESVVAPREASQMIGDPKDAPILNAAILENVDVIVTGDRHFLSLDIEYPRILSPAVWMDSYI